MKIIHFVCVGNVYRSRLAEAYFNSLEIPQTKAISSGIHAQNNAAGPICWYSERIILNNALVNFMSPHWQPTTLELLEKSDLNIFMDQKIYDFARSVLGYFGNNHTIWSIPDFECHYHLDPKESEKEDITLLEKSELTFLLLKEDVNKLVQELT
jgi:protein-tyrosine-phosphatase